jgi:hypothetical protein
MSTQAYDGLTVIEGPFIHALARARTSPIADSAGCSALKLALKTAARRLDRIGVTRWLP